MKRQDIEPNWYEPQDESALPMNGSIAGSGTQNSPDRHMADIINALDRCDHGRHKGDSCIMCPRNVSAGNDHLQVGQRIGTDLYGRPIVVPPPDLRRVARMWLPGHLRSTERTHPV